MPHTKWDLEGLLEEANDSVDVSTALMALGFTDVFRCESIEGRRE